MLVWNRLLFLLTMFAACLPIAPAQSASTLLSSIQSDNQQLVSTPLPPAGTPLGPSVLTLLQNRKALVEALIRTSPAQVRSILLPGPTASGLIAADPAVASLIETDGPRTGTLHVGFAEDLAHGFSQPRYTLKSSTGTISLYPTTTLNLGALINRRVSASGVGTSAYLAAESVQPAPAATTTSTTSDISCTTKGDQNTAVIILEMPGLVYPAGKDDPGFWQTRFFDPATRSLNSIWREMSANQTSASGSVYGPYTLNQAYDCDQSEEISAAGFAAASGQVDLSTVTRVAFIFPTQSCGWVGLGTLGCEEADANVTHPYSRFWVSINPNTDFGDDLDDTVSHEMGHNLTLGHANSYDYGTEALGPFDTANTDVVNTEYADPYSTMGHHGGFYAAPHRALFLNWLQPGTDYHEVQSSGTYTVLPTQTNSGVRALRIQRNPVPGSWVWVEYRQNTGSIDTLIPNTVPNSTIFQGALIHYEDPYLIDSTFNGMPSQPMPTTLTSNLLDMNPEATPNNFATATLLPGSSWSDPYSLLTLTTESADADGLVLKVNYDTACATLTPSFAGLFPTAGSSGSIAVNAPSTCAWTASSVTPWITLSGATSGSGNGSVPFTVMENEDLLQRTGFITIERQSLPLSQKGNAISADVSPIPGSGLNQTFTIDLTSLDTEAFDALQSFELEFAPFTGPNLLGGASFCHVVASVGSDRDSLLLQLQDDSTGQFFPVTPLPLPGPAASASTSHCSLSTAGASVAFNPDGTEATVQLPLTFSSEYPGSYTASLTTTFTGQGQSASLASVPFGAWTVPGTPAVTSVSPSSIRVGYVGPISFGGAFTHFSNASTIVSNFLSLSAPSAPSIVALNGTLHAASNAPVGSQAFSIETGNEIVNASINLVAGVPSSINLETSSSPIFQGGSTSVTVSVSGYGPTPTGIVTLYNGQTVLGTSPLSNGDAVFALDSLGVGTLSLTATYSGDNVFLPSTTQADTLAVFGFTISASPSSLSVVAGNSATSVITITPGVGGFPSAIQLACSGAPAGTTCSLSPSTITPGAAAATAALTLTTTAIASDRPHTDATTALFALLLGGLPWIGLTARLRRHPFSLLSITLIAGLVVCSGCGDGGYTRHLAQPATLTITGTASGATTLVQTSDIAVAIN